MVEVRFACISTVEGVGCTLDGVTKYSDSSGIAYFYGISQGEHTYSIVAPEGMVFVSGQDPFGRPLYESGITTIEWALIPGEPWPEDQPWTMAFTFEEISEPPIVSNVTINAPVSAEADVSFNVSGYVLDQYNVGIVGVTVYLYDNGIHFATTTTGSNGYYLHPYLISLPGVHELAANADSVWAYRNITITEVAPPPGDIIIKIVATPVADGYLRYHGKTVDEPLDPSFWSTQPDKIFKTTGAGFTHTQTVELVEGSHYVIYGNSASAGYLWHVQIFVNDTLIAEGDVDRGNQLRGDFTIGEAPPPGIPTTTTINIPDKVGVDEKFNISGILYETEAGIPIPNQPINHSYNGRSLGGSTTGIDGDYLKEISIPEAGVWTLKSEFPGTETLQASRSLAESVVAATPIATALLIAGPIATGLALFVYGTM